MNTELLERIAVQLDETDARTKETKLRRKDAPIKFDMNDIVYTRHGQNANTCGTAMCIAGLACFLANPDWRLEQYGGAEARALLGLTNEQEDRLFYMLHTPIKLEEVTPKMAAATIRRLIATGKVVWSLEP